MTDVNVEEMIAEDLPCICCGYNLRSRRLQDRCPECGLPVAPSVNAHRDPKALVPRPTLMSAGLMMVASSFALQLTLILLMEFDVRHPVSEIVRIAQMLLVGTGILITVYAMKGSVASSAWLRYSIPWASLVFMVSASIEPVFQLNTWSAGVFLGKPMFHAEVFYVARDLGSFLLVLLIVGLMIQLLRLNLFLPALKLRTATWFICMPVVIGFALMLMESIIGEISFERGISAGSIEWIMNLFVLLELPCLIAWPGMAVLMILYHRAIQRLTRKSKINPQ